MRDADTTDGADESTRPNRRSVLRGIGTAATATVGVSALTGTAGAQATAIDVISVDDGLFGWSADSDLPVTEELFVFVHGWFGDTTVESQAADVLGSVEAGGYDPDEAVAIEWPATNLIYPVAESDTEDVGEVVAGLIEDFYDEGGGNVRLTGHSLGGRTACWVPTKIGSSYTVDTVGALGAAADGSNVCEGGQWHDGIADNTEEFRNYFSNNDSTVGGAYGGFGDTALGAEGAGCPGPDTYTDVDVTDSVGGHLEYLGDEAVGSDFAEAILDDDGDSGDDGGDDGGFF